MRLLEEALPQSPYCRDLWTVLKRGQWCKSKPSFYVNLSLSDVIKWLNGCYIQTRVTQSSDAVLWWRNERKKCEVGRAWTSVHRLQARRRHESDLMTMMTCLASSCCIPKKHLLSFSPIISSLIQKCRICNQVTDGTVGSKSRGWCKEVCFYQKCWSQWRQRCTLYLFYIMVWVNIHPDWLQGVPGVPVKLHWLHSVSLYVKWLKSMV